MDAVLIKKTCGGRDYTSRGSSHNCDSTLNLLAMVISFKTVGIALSSCIIDAKGEVRHLQQSETWPAVAEGKRLSGGVGTR